MTNYSTGFTLIMLISVNLSLTVINFFTWIVTHSHLFSVCFLFHFAQLAIYVAKFRLFMRHCKNGKNLSRSALVVDLFISTFVCAFCFLTFVRCVESLSGHHKVHNDDHEDKLHHSHWFLNPTQKLLLMKFTSIITFSVDLAIALHFIVSSCFIKRKIIIKKGKKTDSGELKKHDHHLIGLTPSDLIARQYKWLFVFLLLVGPAKTILNSYAGEYLERKNNQPASPIVSNLTETNTSLVHHHDHHDDHSKQFVFSEYVVINADPIMSISLSFIYLFYFALILKLAGWILAQAVPEFIDVQQVKQDLEEIDPSIVNVHELFLYEWTPYSICVNLHFVLLDDPTLSRRELLQRASQEIEDYFLNKFNVHYLIAQPEFTHERTSNNQCLLAKN